MLLLLLLRVFLSIDYFPFLLNLLLFSGLSIVSIITYFILNFTNKKKEEAQSNLSLVYDFIIYSGVNSLLQNDMIITVFV